MRAVVQRVSRAQVNLGEEVVVKIGPGLLVLLGVGKNDAMADAEYLAAKITGLRIFEDDDGKMNLALVETHGAVLAVSQFTLYGGARKGKRPSFDDAAPPELARELYEYFVAKDSRCWNYLRDWPLPGHDASRIGKRRASHDSAGFSSCVLSRIEHGRPAFHDCIWNPDYSISR